LRCDGTWRAVMCDVMMCSAVVAAAAVTAQGARQGCADRSEVVAV
jgi:hypothetical protein